MTGTARTTQILLLASAAAFLAFGLLLTPENLLRLEIMENSLESQSEVIRRGAWVEIAVARIAGFTFAAALLLLALVWPRIEGSKGYRAFMDRRRVSLRDHRGFRRRFRTPSAAVMAAAIALTFLWIVTADSFLSHAQLRFMHREDGVFQTLSALFLLAAAAISVRVALRLGRGRPEFYMHLFLGFLFFLMFGEEISWGQRYLEFETPGAIAAVNAQGEANLHNMFGYFFDHLFILAFFLWGVAVPLLDRYAIFFRQLFAAIGLPVPSAGMAVAMLAISMMQTVIVYKFIDPLPTLRLAEARELLSALAFVVLMLEVWFLVGRRLPAEAG